MSRTALMLSWTVCSKSSKLRFHDIPLYWKYTVSQKNAPTLASSSFDKHGLISIIFGKQRQHTFKNDMPMRVQLSLSLHVYLLYLLLNSCDGNIDLTQWTEMTRSDVTRYSWNNPAPSAGNNGFYFSRSVSAKQSGWLQNLWTGAGTCVHCTNTVQISVRDTNCCDHAATWSSASLTHGQACQKTPSTK